MKNKGFILTWLIIAAFLSVGFTSCVTIPFATKNQVEKELAALRQAKDTEKQEALAALSTQKDVVIKSQENQLQSSVNSLWGATEGFKYYRNPGRIDLIINNRVTEAVAVIGKAPTYEAILAENKRMAIELDEVKTSLDQLKKTHDEVVLEKTKISDEKNKQVELVVQMEREQAIKEKAAQKLIDEKQSKLNEVNNEIIVKVKAAADSQASTERLKNKLMIACGIAALACLAGAIYSPIGKQGFAIGGVVLGGATVAIPYIEGWMIAVAILVVALIGGLIAAVKFNLLNKTNTNMVHAIQDDIESGSETIKNKLKSWNTKYVKNADGSVTEIPDVEVEKLIKSKLMEIGRLPTDVNPVVPPKT